MIGWLVAAVLTRPQRECRAPTEQAWLAHISQLAQETPLNWHYSLQIGPRHKLNLHNLVMKNFNISPTTHHSISVISKFASISFNGTFWGNASKCWIQENPNSSQTVRHLVSHSNSHHPHHTTFHNTIHGYLFVLTLEIHNIEILDTTDCAFLNKIEKYLKINFIHLSRIPHSLEFHFYSPVTIV